jgi:type IV secretion system protein VirD4
MRSSLWAGKSQGRPVGPTGNGSARPLDAIPKSLLYDLPRGDPNRPPEEFEPPRAMYARPDTVRSYDWQGGKTGKIFLGVVDGTVTTDEEGRPYVAGGRAVGIAEDRHLMLVAGSRAGKGRAVLVPNLLHYPGSVLATDPKGELATITARRRVEMGQKVCVLDPFGVAAGYPHEKNLIAGFNPIEAMRTGRHLVEDGALIADALVVVAGKDPHWDEAAKAFIEGVILHVKTWRDFEGRRNLLTVRELVGGDKATLDVIDGGMRKNEAGGGVIQSAAADFFDRKGNEKASVLSSARRHLKFIDLFRDPENPLGRRTLEQHDLELHSLKTEATTVYLCLPARHIATCNRWLRLFVNMTLQGMEQPLPKGKKLPGNSPVLCVLDEFAALGYMAQVEAAAGQIAGFGVKLWPVLQDIAQLKALYETRWETFMGNAGVVQFFGNNDLSTLEWISKRLDKTSIEVVRENELTLQQTRRGATGASRGTEVHNLVTLDEAGRFFGRGDPQFRQLVIHAGEEEPFLVLQRAYYDKHELFAGLFDPPRQ